MIDALAMHAWCWCVIVIAPLFYSAYIVCSTLLPKDLNVVCRVVLENTEIMCAKWFVLSFTLCARGASLLLLPRTIPSLHSFTLYQLWKEKSFTSIDLVEGGRARDKYQWQQCWWCMMLSLCLQHAMIPLMFRLFITCIQDASALQFCDVQHIAAIYRKIEN